jgi:hypothetical protein
MGNDELLFMDNELTSTTPIVVRLFTTVVFRDLAPKYGSQGAVPLGADTPISVESTFSLNV